MSDESNEEKALKSLKTIIENYGMETLLSALITYLYFTDAKLPYIKKLILDLTKTLENYKKRYE